LPQAETPSASTSTGESGLSLLHLKVELDVGTLLVTTEETIPVSTDSGKTGKKIEIIKAMSNVFALVGKYYKLSLIFLNELKFTLEVAKQHGF
jgi:hypothetical protein